VIRVAERVFVDTGAWIALAVVRDPLHERSRDTYGELLRVGARLLTSTAVVLETFTYLDRKGSRDLASRWLAEIEHVSRLQVLDFTASDVRAAVRHLARKELHKLGLVDALSFVLMHRHRIRCAFAFDTHFAVAGFRLA
jgi:predicted nucleic acid-binding protein